MPATTQRATSPKFKKQRMGKKKGRATKAELRERKGSPSKTQPGRLDFTTKKTSKDFDRGHHRYQHALGQHFVRRPYHETFA